jgi:hypothetical protein
VARAAVERFFAWLKGGFRRLALRYERRLATFAALVHLACLESSEMSSVFQTRLLKTLSEHILWPVSSRVTSIGNRLRLPKSARFPTAGLRNNRTQRFPVVASVAVVLSNGLEDVSHSE